MFDRNFKTLSTCFLFTVTFSLLLSFVTPTYAFQAELDQVDHSIRSRGRHWLAKETPISRLPHQERMMRLGLMLPASPPTNMGAPASNTSSTPLTTTAAASLDWRNIGGYSYVTPVRDQGNCGSCWAFATAAALESNTMIAMGDDTDRSEQILVSCSGAGSCNGGYIDRASNYISNTGLPSESYYPYTQKNGFCSTSSAGWQNDTSRITSWHYAGGTTSPSLDQIKEALNIYGPLVTTMNVYTDFYYYGGGIYTYSYGSYQGGHAVLIVGYDDAEQYFIVKNSWGSGWGESGYFKIGYSELNSVVNFGAWTIAYYTYIDTTAPGITVMSPNGSESWETGTTKTIQWSYTGNPGTSVAIELYNNGSLNSVLNSSVPIGSGGTGSYSWNIPSTQSQGNLYQIKVASTSDAFLSDVSDNSFTITAPPPPATSSVKVTAPNGGELWKRGSTQTIRWTYTGSPGTYVKIELLKSGKSVKTLTSRGRTTTGYYTWKVPSKQSTGSDYTIRLTSTSNSSYTDTSDSSFSIIK